LIEKWECSAISTGRAEYGASRFAFETFRLSKRPAYRKGKRLHHPVLEQKETTQRQAEEIGEAAAARIRTKYVLGQLEHGGNLFNKPVLHEAFHEVTDLFTYLYVEARQKREAIGLLETWLTIHDNPPREIVEARNILVSGNARGD